MPAFFARLSDALNRKLFDIPRLSPAHDVVPQGPFRSKIVRWIWGWWFRVLAPGGRYFFLATGLFLLYAASSLEFQGLVPFSYASVVWLIALVAQKVSKPVAQLEFSHPSRIAAGEALPVEIEIWNRKKSLLAGAHVIPHRLPDEIDVSGEIASDLPPLEQNANARLKLRLQPRKRGVYTLRGFRIESDFPFGILNAHRVFEAPSRLLVYPKFDPLERLELPQGRRYQPGGVAFVAARGESVEYIGNRDYREGDNVRDIDWRATARLNRPIVREFREEFFLRAAIVLDTHIPNPSPEKCADFERAVSLAAACGDAMNRMDYLVDLLAAGPNLYHLMAGRGLASVDQMLDILACVDSTTVSPWPTLAPALGETLERITSVICLFLDWDEARRAFATELSRSGVAVKVVILRDEATTGAPTLDPRDSWPGEVPVFGVREWEIGVRRL